MKSALSRYRWPVVLMLFGVCGCFRPDPIGSSQKGNPISMNLEFAERLQIDSLDSLWIFHVNTPDGLVESFEVPVVLSHKPRLVILSSVFAGFLYELNAQDLIVGIDNQAYYSNPDLLHRVQLGEVKSLSAGGALQVEQLVALNPDWVVHSGYGELKPELISQLKKRGITVLTCNNYLESDPLGRAEWIKFFGAITGYWNEALAHFDLIKTEYLNRKKKPAKNAPDVLVGAMFGGVWDVPGGQSYVAKLIADAGGNYLWKELNQVGKQSLSLEQVAEKALNAHVWINPGPFQSASELAQADSRYTRFNAFQNQRVFNHYHNLSALGPNAYWERAAARPDWILHDLKLIFYPNELPQNSLLLYSALKAK